VSDTSQAQSRRKFLARMTIAMTAAAGAVVGLPMLAFLLSPLIQPVEAAWRTLGPIDTFKPGETVQVSFEDPSPLPWAGLTAETAVWVRRTNTTPEEFIVFAVNCTHLGCPVNWVPGGNIFLCPCHGGVYYADGTVAAGPPPRSLFRYQVRVFQGQLQLLTRPLPVS
jgi:menaquinol-cytochrome c reductase iron-sulfur subunit